MDTGTPAGTENMQPAKYTYAYLGRGDLGFYRLFGDGLGNVLFPWARSILAARDGSLTEIWPAWRQIFHRGGWRTLWKELRGEYGLKNLRNYDNIFQPTGAQITGARKLALLLRSHRVSEEALAAAGGFSSLPEGGIVTFEGLGRRFVDLVDEHDFLRAVLWERTSAQIREKLGRGVPARSICLHVRLGDFLELDLKEALRLGHNSRLPQSWYVEKVRQLRAALGEDWPVFVFSDGHESELTEILSVPGSRRVSFGSAMGDLWAMTGAGVMICSLSTLVNWACYFGRSPSIRMRGIRNPSPLYVDAPEAEIESGIGEELPSSFAAIVRRHLSAREESVSATP